MKTASFKQLAAMSVADLLDHAEVASVQDVWIQLPSGQRSVTTALFRPVMKERTWLIPVRTHKGVLVKWYRDGEVLIANYPEKLGGLDVTIRLLEWEEGKVPS